MQVFHQGVYLKVQGWIIALKQLGDNHYLSVNAECPVRFHTILAWPLPPPKQKQWKGMKVTQTKWVSLPKKRLSVNLKYLKKWFVPLSHQTRNISLSLPGCCLLFEWSTFRPHCRNPAFGTSVPLSGSAASHLPCSREETVALLPKWLAQCPTAVKSRIQVLIYLNPKPKLFLFPSYAEGGFPGGSSD